MSQEPVDLSKIECTADDVSVFLNISSRRIQQMAKSEIIHQKKRGIFSLQDVVQSYIGFLKKGQASSPGEAAALDYNTEKTLLTKAQREKAELEVAVIRGELHRGEDVRAVMGNMIIACKSKLCSIPSKLAPQLLAQTDIPVLQDIIKREIDEALKELSDYNAKSFNRRNKKVISVEGDD
jgi:phage terminase Nu1 subunit (DNA packaging protein)